MHKLLLLFLISLINGSFFLVTQSQRSQPLANAYSHNDYWRDRPLYDAIDNGFTSIEADIFLKKGQLVVAHTFPSASSPTLESLYLQPLQQYLSHNNGQIYQGYSQPFILMIDIKGDAVKTYEALHLLLVKYRNFLSSYENSKIIQRQISVVLTGHKPYASLASQSTRYAFIDADLRDVFNSHYPAFAGMFTTASCKYSKLISWRGEGSMPAAEKQTLCNYVRAAHQQGSKVRLWASPENEQVWAELLACGVDLINTDELVGLKTFLHSEQASLAIASLSSSRTEDRVPID